VGGIDERHRRLIVASLELASYSDDTNQADITASVPTFGISPGADHTRPMASDRAEIAPLAINPTLTTAQAAEVLREHWGLTATFRELGSTEDQNLLARTADGTGYVLKITGASTTEERLDLQNAALRAVSGLEVDVPQVVPTLDGRDTVTEGEYRIRLLTFVEGVALVDRPYLRRQDMAELGVLAGRLADALTDFDHPALRHENRWDGRRSGTVMRALLIQLPDGPDADLIAQTVESFDAIADAHLLPEQALHADVSDLNTVCRPQLGNGSTPVGIIDFGDVMWTWRIGDVVAIAVALAGRDEVEDVLAAAIAALEGYLSQRPLTDAELDAYWPAVLARAGVCLATSSDLARLNPDSAFLQRAVTLDRRALQNLLEVPVSLANAAIRAAGGLAPAARVEFDSLRPHHLIAGLPTLAPLDLSVESEAFAFGEWARADELDGLLDNGFGYGRWGEGRLPGVAALSPNAPTNLSLGADVFASAGTRVHAPLDAMVVSVAARECVLDLRPSGVDLYLRLSGLAAMSLKPGALVRAGARIGVVAPRTTGQLLAPSVGCQLMAEPDLPAFGHAHWRDAWLTICPDPSVLVGCDVAAPAVPSAAQTRRAHDQVVATPQHLYFTEPPAMVRGWRHILYDSSGRGYLDMVNNVASVGHSHPEVAAAATRQLRRLNTNSRFLYDSITRYSERISALLPAELDVVFLVNSGSEAADLALQLGQVFTGRKDLIALRGGYHGWTGAVLDVCTSDMDRPNWAHETSTHVHPVEPPDPYRGPFGNDGPRYADAVARACTNATERGTPIAAFISEPLLGNQGGIVAASGYLAAAYDIVRAAGGICIADEVQVGLGRTGSSTWAFEPENVVPDIVISAKSAGNGHPLGVVICRREIADAFDAHNSYFSSAGGGPVSCEIGLAVLDALRDEDLPGNALRVGERLRAGLLELAERHASIAAVYGRGLFLGVDLIRDRSSKEPDPTLAAAVSERMRELGVIVTATGDAYNVLKIKPPLCIDDTAADYFVAMLDRALTDVS
jgi:4-aminobutyrate aminotransferase-like enzyme/Ser/Thr protein kinase RdoA (MazF antagonist)